MKLEQESAGSQSAKIHYLFNSNIDKGLPKDLTNIANKVKELKPSVPVYFIRPYSIQKAAKFFLEKFKTPKFSSDILFSVKSNPDEAVLKYLFKAGIKHFDVASMSEVKLIKNLFGEDAVMYLMHPIKSPETIYEAYFDYGIRDFSLDSVEELEKILQVTKHAKDLGLHARLSIPNSHAAIDLSGKFGILPSESTSFLRKTRASAQRLGICFHVGSQCMDPVEYRNALTITKEVLESSGVKPDVIDIGGGFPSTYPGMTPPDLQVYFDEIFDSLNQLNLDANCRIWCEPGRALVAEAGSLLVRVEGKKKGMLYLNDGTYGGLFDAGFAGFIYPTKAIRITDSGDLSTHHVPYGFYGPTCDSLDVMKGPFYLPEDISEGDYIEIGQLGAYSRSMRTQFNGFDENIQIEVLDEPLVSMYQTKENQENIQSA